MLFFIVINNLSLYLDFFNIYLSNSSSNSASELPISESSLTSILIILIILFSSSLSSIVKFCSMIPCSFNLSNPLNNSSSEPSKLLDIPQNLNEFLTIWGEIVSLFSHTLIIHSNKASLLTFCLSTDLKTEQTN